MEPPIDTTFDFHSDTPPGKDCDAASPTLKRYHQLLWSKPLPSGVEFTLAPEGKAYLVHRSEAGTHYLSSDAITTNLLGRAAKVIEELPTHRQPRRPRYTIGRSIIFPGDRREGKATINGARGFHPRIADRFDLTLECIRRHYAGLRSPLSEALDRFSDFFALFVDFEKYVEFFLLQDLLDETTGNVQFFHDFDDFQGSAVPRTADRYLRYVEASEQFAHARDYRIDAYVRTALAH